jgi:outer membrane protein OmpA-like peptidoglycan-associated protein
MSDNKTLIFASYRKGGKGDFDLYLSKMSDDGEWSYPMNLAFLNTSESDQFVSASASGDIFYYYSKGDIYTIAVPQEFHQSKNITVQGFIIDANTKKPIKNAIIKVCDATTTKEIINLTNNPADGRYTVVLTEGRKYNMQVSATNYSSNSEFYDLVSIAKYEEINRTIELSSKVGLLLNIYDKERYTPIEAKLTFTNALTSEKLSEYNKTASEGRSHTDLPIGLKYRIYANADKYKEKYFDFDLTSIIKFNEFEKNIELELKEPGKDLTTIKGVIVDATSKKPIDATFEIIDNEKNEIVATFQNDPITGEYLIELPAGKNYGIVVKSDKYLFHSENLNVDFSNLNEQNTLTLDIPMKKAEIGAKIILNNIFFDFGKTTLRSESVAELNNIVKQLNEMPTLNVEISGHTDNIGTKETNMRISNERAKTVVDYLIANGIDKNRLTNKGYGFDQPTVSNDTEEGRQKNRRTEFKIISK